jgi:hypothetical protein
MEDAWYSGAGMLKSRLGMGVSHRVEEHGQRDGKHCEEECDQTAAYTVAPAVDVVNLRDEFADGVIFAGVSRLHPFALQDAL